MAGVLFSSLLGLGLYRIYQIYQNPPPSNLSGSYDKPIFHQHNQNIDRSLTDDRRRELQDLLLKYPPNLLTADFNFIEPPDIELDFPPNSGLMKYTSTTFSITVMPEQLRKWLLRRRSNVKAILLPEQWQPLGLFQVLIPREIKSLPLSGSFIKPFNPELSQPSLYPSLDSSSSSDSEDLMDSLRVKTPENINLKKDSSSSSSSEEEEDSKSSEEEEEKDEDLNFPFTFGFEDD